VNAVEHPDLTAWIDPALQLGRSEIDGQGLFTRNDVRSGSTLIRFGGYLFSASERFNEGLVQPSSVVGVAESVILAEQVTTSRDQSDYINHSCEANAGMGDALTVVAKHFLRAGSEITCDYAYWETESSYRMKKQCRCRSDACRGAITGMDWSKPELRSEILRWASPFIRRRLVNAH
jgi:uncharacterized protein